MTVAQLVIKKNQDSTIIKSWYFVLLGFDGISTMQPLAVSTSCLGFAQQVFDLTHLYCIGRDLIICEHFHALALPNKSFDLTLLLCYVLALPTSLCDLIIKFAYIYSSTQFVLIS